MKPETLQALLLDRALGELPSETAELLEAYLAVVPERSAHAQHLAATVAAARAAVAVDASSPQSSETLRPWRLGFTPRVIANPEVWRLAACLVLGGLVGWGGTKFAADRTPVVIVTRPAVTRGPVHPATTPAHAPANFWRPASLMRSDALPAHDTSHYRLRWDPSHPAPTLEETP